MEHIIFECPVEGRLEIWEYAEKLWNKTTTINNPWIIPTIDMIRGLGKMQIKRKKSQRRAQNRPLQDYSIRNDVDNLET